MTDWVIDVKGLSKRFNKTNVVNSLNLKVKKGEVFGFLGPNGSGKTTSIRMLCGILTPDSGSGTCLGFDVIKESEKIKQNVGYMTQKFSYYTELSVEENLNFIAQVFGVSDRKNRIEEILENYNLTDIRHQLTGTLSGGWKQRVALAASLIHRPSLLLLDEPTAGVDPIARREFWDKIHSLSEQGITTFVSTHYMDEAERCTRLAYLAYGNLLITGTVDDVIASTHLLTWQITGNVTTHLLQKAKKIPSIMQAAFFGNHIHICGFDQSRIENGLEKLAKKFPIQWSMIQSTLEDAFISLVTNSTKQSPEEIR